MHENNGCNEQLSRILATQFALYAKVWAFHWNLVGTDFAERHGLYGSWKDELGEDIDVVAERIRQLGGVALGGLSEFINESVIEDTDADLLDEARTASILKGDYHVLRSLVGELIDMTEGEDKVTSNIAQDLGAKYDKVIWFLESICHGSGSEEETEIEISL